MNRFCLRCYFDWASAFRWSLSFTWLVVGYNQGDKRRRGLGNLFQSIKGQKTLVAYSSDLFMAVYHDFCRRTLFARHENRLFYPVVYCDGPKITPAGDMFYTVYFSDGWCKNVASFEIIGPHFSSIDAGTQLYLGQRVFAFYLGQEHRGSVIDQVGDMVRVRLDQLSELLCFNVNQLRLSADIARPHFGSTDSFQNFMKQNKKVEEEVTFGWVIEHSFGVNFIFIGIIANLPGFDAFC